MTHDRVRPIHFHTFISIIVCALARVCVWQELAAKTRVISSPPLFFALFVSTEVRDGALQYRIQRGEYFNCIHTYIMRACVSRFSEILVIEMGSAKGTLGMSPKRVTQCILGPPKVHRNFGKFEGQVLRDGEK